MSIALLRGVIPPVPTMVNEDGSFAAQGMGVLIDRLLASDINGFLFLGSAGEFAQLSNAARREIAQFCVSRVAGRRPVIIGTASCSTAEVIELSVHASDIGADAVMVVNPYYSLLSEERLYTHYRRIAEASPLPVLLYNFPALTGQDLSVDLVARLAKDCPNIVGIKDSAGSYDSLKGYLDAVRGLADFAVLSGPDHLAHQGFLDGCSACISGLANV